MAAWDAIVLGGGPAGATIARLLARWNHRVLLVHRQTDQRPRAESLPPSIYNLFELLGVRDDVEAAGFWPNGGNTSWWTSDSPRVEHFAAGATGYHVERPAFDELLRRLAADAGVTVAAERPQEEDWRFLADCSGANGFFARTYRVADTRYRTMCLSAEWTGTWDTDPTHALVEAYAGGWGWSVPLAPGRRRVAFMVDHGVQRGGARKAYEDQLSSTRVFRRMFGEACRMEGVPSACDVPMYWSRQYAGPSWLLAGDAASAIDPLSSFGVKKALISAWMGAVVINTCLRRPEMSDAAIRLYNERERQTYADHARQAALQFGELTSRFPCPFWERRAQLAPDLQLYDPAELRLAHEQLRASPGVRLRLREPLRVEPVPAITGHEVTLVDRMILPGLPPTIEYVQGVNLVQLAQLAERHDSVPALFDAYNRVGPAVALSNFVSALSFLLAGGILKNIWAD